MEAKHLNIKLIESTELTIKGITELMGGNPRRVNSLNLFYMFDHSPEIQELKQKYNLNNLDIKYDLLNNAIPFPRYCAVCGKQLHVNANDLMRGYAKTCSKACSYKDPNRTAKLSKLANDKTIIARKLKKAKSTNLIRYGVDYAIKSPKVKEKIKNTLTEKYGVDNVFKLKEFQDKAKATNLKRYGSEVSILNPEVRAKAKETNLKKYGTEYAIQSFEVRLKILNSLIDKYNVSNVMQVAEFKNNNLEAIKKNFNDPSVNNISQIGVIKDKKLSTHCDTVYESILKYCAENNNIVTPAFTKEEYFKIRDNIKDKYKAMFVWKCNECNKVFLAPYVNGLIPTCRYCHPITRRNLQNSIVEYIKSIYKGDLVLENKNIIPPMELDIYIPELKLAIEIDGDYWHSENAGKSSSYHLNKTEQCEAKGIHLIHIFEHQWNNNKDIVKFRLFNILSSPLNKIFARKCEVKVIDNKISHDFQNSYHLQEGITSAINLGLFYNNNLVSVMTFGKPRFNKNYEWELLRFCSIPFVHILGGASKLLKYFERNYKPKSLISYANRCWSSKLSNVYSKIGFNLIDTSAPSYFYTKNGVVLSRYQCQKHKLKNILLDKYDESKTESENMSDNGFNKIYDCGNLVFAKTY